MKAKRAAKELEKKLRKEPSNLVLRLRLAAALRELGRTAEAVELYRSVAVEYHAGGRLAQAIAVCRSVLEIDPGQRETQALLAQLEAGVRVPVDAVGSPNSVPPGLGSAADGPDVALAAAPPASRSGRSASVRIVEAAPRTGLAAAPRTDEFSHSSGLTPIADHLEVPSLARSITLDEPTSRSSITPTGRKTVDPSITEESRPPGVRSRRRSNPRYGARDTRPTGPPRTTQPLGVPFVNRLTPTPLPAPVPAHELDEDSIVTHPNARRRAVGSAPTGVARGSADSHASHSELTDDDLLEELDSVDEVTPIRQPTAPPIAAAVARTDARLGGNAIAPATARVGHEVSDGLHEDSSDSSGDSSADSMDEGNDDSIDDDALTRVAPESGRHHRPPLEPTRPASAPVDDVFNEATRFGDSLAEVGAAALRPGTRPAAPPSPIRQTLPRPGKPLPPAPVDESRLTAPNLGGVAPRGKPARAPVDIDDEETRPEAFAGGAGAEPDPEDSLDGDPTRLRPPGFADGYTEVLDGLAPDGSAIDAPMTVFSELPEQALEELVRRMALRSVSVGEIILREGDPGDACFIIASGSVRVLKRDPANATPDLIEVARLGVGAIFGEFALLADRRRHATVQAVEPCELYEVSRRLLLELSRRYADVGPALERFYRERLLSTLIATAPFFAPLAPDRRTELLSRFTPMHRQSGQTILEEGDRAGGLFLIVLGSVEITKRLPDGREVLLTTLDEGSYFGELSLMRGGTARATVTAAGPTELARLPPSDFYELVAANPVLWTELRREAHRRELLINQIIAGETTVV